MCVCQGNMEGYCHSAHTVVSYPDPALMWQSGPLSQYIRLRNVSARAVIFCHLIGSLDFSTADSARTKKMLQTLAEGGVWVRDYPHRNQGIVAEACSSVCSLTFLPPPSHPYTATVFLVVHTFYCLDITTHSSGF